MIDKAGDVRLGAARCVFMGVKPRPDTHLQAAGRI